MHNKLQQDSPWSVAITSGLILGLVIGIPYYSLPYFYDYFEHAPSAGGFGWSRASIMLGLPIGTLVTLVAGPWFMRRLPPKPCIVCGAAVCAAALSGFGLMSGSLTIYYLLWLLYMTGWTFAGSLAHQILLTQAFTARRSAAFAIAFFGISAIGALSVVCLARPLTNAFGFHTALVLMGGVVAFAVPVAQFGLPDFRVEPHVETDAREAAPVENSAAFWLLLIGTTLAVSGIAGVSQHLKLILSEVGYAGQIVLDEVFGWTLMAMLSAAALGRFLFAWTVDRFGKMSAINASFILMTIAIPMLMWWNMPYGFGAAFGLGISCDALMVPLLASDHFKGNRLARAMSWIVPANTVGQTWAPYVVSLAWSFLGAYTIPVFGALACMLAGRFVMAFLPDPVRARG